MLLLKRPQHDSTLPWCRSYEPVALSTTQAYGGKEIGCECMCLQMSEKPGIASVLQEEGFDPEAIQIALISLISCIIVVSSGHKTTPWFAQNSGLTELFDLKQDSIPTRYHLYEASS